MNPFMEKEEADLKELFNVIQGKEKELRKVMEKNNKSPFEMNAVANIVSSKSLLMALVAQSYRTNAYLEQLLMMLDKEDTNAKD